MSKVLLISTRKSPDWESWKELKDRGERQRSRVTMTQTEALTIWKDVVTANTTGAAVQSLVSKMLSRRHFSYWLTQVGYRQAVKLGRGKGFVGYVTAVVECIRARKKTHVEKEGETMGKRDDKPVVVIRKGRSRATTNGSDEADDRTKVANEVTPVPTDKEPDRVISGGPEKAHESDTMGTLPADKLSVQNPTMSRVQEYNLKTLRVYADCAVQRDEAGIIDVLARNFEDKALLNFWLWKAGLGHLSKLIRNKDLLDSLRIISRELHREMKQSVGQPVSRW